MNNFKIKYLKYKTKYLRLKNNIIAGSTTDELQNDWKIFFLGQEIKLDPMYYEDETEYIEIVEGIKIIKKDEDFDWSNYIIKKRFKNNGPKLKVNNPNLEKIGKDIKEIFIEAEETDHIAKAIKNGDLKLNTGFINKIAFIEKKIVYGNGTTYEGGLKDDKFHGKGKITYRDGYKEGEFKNGEFIFGKIEHGDLIKNGYFDNGKLTKGYIGNTSKSFFQDGYFESNFEEVEILHGQGYRFTSDFEEEGKFEYGVLINGKKTYVDGHKEEGEFTYGNLSKGKKSDVSGIIKIGNFDDDLLISGKKYYPDTSYEEGEFEDDILVKGKKIYPDKLNEEGEFKDGKLNGKGKRYKNGIIFEEGEFENGILIKNKNKRKLNQIGGGKTNDNTDLIPKKSISKNFIKLEFPYIIVSQCEYPEGPCGLTFIRSKKGFRVYKEIRGGWPGHIDCLSNNDKQIIDGINISGGSLLGLESTTGLTSESLKYSKYKNWMGLNGAIIYSGNLANNMIYPDKKLGIFAFNQSDNKLYSGQVGAGLSASHGQGWGYKNFNGIKILVLVVNNALGVVYKNNKPLHNPFNAKKYSLDDIKIGKNTTIINVITNLDLDIDDLKQMNQQMNVSIGESIRPFNTLNDGDIFYTCSTMSLKKKLTINQKIKLFDEFSKVLKDAILNSI